jgi:uncharacterized protein (TIGR02594 family)
MPTEPLERGARGTYVREVQEALRAAGHELIADGEFGPVTEAAVKRFQAAHGIAPDGAVGAKTAAALLRAKLPAGVAAPAPAHVVLPSVVAIAPWLAIMRALSGTREIPGAKSNPLILGWVQEILQVFPELAPNLDWYRNDDTPWCGLATAYVMAKTGHKPPFAPLYALSWRDWGIKMVKPALGAVLVFKRAGGGHVGLYEGEDDAAYHVRGGNQSDSINVTRVAKNRCVGIRWPSGAPFAATGQVHQQATGALSTNEA